MARQSVQFPRDVRALLVLALAAVPLGAVACGGADTSFTIDPPTENADCLGDACWECTTVEDDNGTRTVCDRELDARMEVPAQYTCPFATWPNVCPPSSASPDAGAGAVADASHAPDASSPKPDAGVPSVYDCEKDGGTLHCEGPSQGGGGKAHKDGGKGKGKGKGKDKDKDKDKGKDKDKDDDDD